MKKRETSLLDSRLFRGFICLILFSIMFYLIQLGEKIFFEMEGTGLTILFRIVYTFIYILMCIICERDYYSLLTSQVTILGDVFEGGIFADIKIVFYLYHSFAWLFFFFMVFIYPFKMNELGGSMYLVYGVVAIFAVGIIISYILGTLGVRKIRKSELRWKCYVHFCYIIPGMLLVGLSLISLTIASIVGL